MSLIFKVSVWIFKFYISQAPANNWINSLTKLGPISSILYTGLSCDWLKSNHLKQFYMLTGVHHSVFSVHCSELTYNSIMMTTMTGKCRLQRRRLHNNSQHCKGARGPNDRDVEPTRTLLCEESKHIHVFLSDSKAY